MPRLRMQFTVRTLAIFVALIALNLAAAITSWRWYLDSLAQPGEEQDRLGSWAVAPGGPVDAIHVVVARSVKTGEHLERVVWPVPPPNLLQIFSPVIASVSITLLVLTVPWASPAPRSHRAPSATGSTEESSPSRHGAVRLAMIVAALIGLNVASAVYRPLPDPDRNRPDTRGFPQYFLSIDAKYQASFLSEKGQFVIVWSNGTTARPQHNDVEGHVLETIVYRPDGAIVYYEGSPGLFRRLFTWPHVIREPSRTMLEMWWPVPIAAAITLLVLRTLWSQARRHRDNDTFWFGAD